MSIWKLSDASETNCIVFRRIYLRKIFNFVTVQSNNFTSRMLKNRCNSVQFIPCDIFHSRFTHKWFSNLRNFFSETHQVKWIFNQPHYKSVVWLLLTDVNCPKKTEHCIHFYNMSTNILSIQRTYKCFHHVYRPHTWNSV